MSHPSETHSIPTVIAHVATKIQASHNLGQGMALSGYIVVKKIFLMLHSG